LGGDHDLGALDALGLLVELAHLEAGVEILEKQLRVVSVLDDEVAHVHVFFLLIFRLLLGFLAFHELGHFLLGLAVVRQVQCSYHCEVTK